MSHQAADMRNVVPANDSERNVDVEVSVDEVFDIRDVVTVHVVLGVVCRHFHWDVCTINYPYAVIEERVMTTILCNFGMAS